MTMLTTLAADNWSISIGGGWIILMLVGMGLCFIFMLGFMWLMRDGRGWAMCGRWWQQAPPPTDILTGTPRQRPDRTISPESEATGISRGEQRGLRAAPRRLYDFRMPLPERPCG